MSTFWQSASYVLCAEPCACTFLLIFDVYLLDIPPPRAEPPGISLPLNSLSTCKIVQPLRRLRRLPELRGGFFGDPSVCFADSSPSLGSLERFDLYGLFTLVCAHSPYKFVGGERRHLPDSPDNPETPETPDSKVNRPYSFLPAGRLFQGGSHLPIETLSTGTFFISLIYAWQL